MTLPHDSSTVTAAFSAAANARPEQLAIGFEDQRATFHEVDRASRRLAAALLSSGVSRGDRVLLVARNRPEHITWLLASARIGAIHTAVHPDWTATEMHRAIAHAEPVVVATEASRLETVEEACSGLVIGRLVDIDSDPLAGADETELDDDLARPDDDAVLWFTSGTSGRPKGVLWTHSAFLFNALAINRAVGIGPGDVGLRVSPMSHNGVCSAVVGTLLCGAPVHLLQRFEAKRVLDTIQREGVTWTNLVPAAARMALDAAEAAGIETLPTMRRLLVGAAPTPPELLERLVRFLPSCAVVHGYGATEGYISVCRPEAASRVDGSVGTPLPETEVRVVDASGVPCPAGVVGRIRFRNPGVMRAYWRDPEGTTATLVDDGWIDVGDLGQMDDDGHIWVTGREKDVINCGGYNVYASEVESVLTRLPGVRDAAVIGMPDTVIGECVVAFVEATPGTSLDVDDLQERCAVDLARYKRPSSIHVVDQLPRNTYGKVLKNELTMDGSR